MLFDVPTTPVRDGQDPHTVGRLRDGEQCSQCDKPATHLRYGRPCCKEHR